MTNSQQNHGRTYRILTFICTSIDTIGEFHRQSPLFLEENGTVTQVLDKGYGQFAGKIMKFSFVFSHYQRRTNVIYFTCRFVMVL